MPSQTFTTSGSWTAPANVDPSSVQVVAWGPSGTAANGGSSFGGGGGGGGALGAELTLGGISGGTILTITIGAAGSGNATTVTGGSVTVTGNHGGNASTTAGGAAGAVSGNSTTFAGGAGGGAGSGTGGAGGGGGSAGLTGAGGTGGAGSGTTGGAGGSAGTGPTGFTGAAGGKGGNVSGGGSVAGTVPGSGGGGGAGGSQAAAAGADGQVIITWSVATTSTGSFALAPLAFSGTGTGTTTSTGSFTLAPLAFSANGAVAGFAVPGGLLNIAPGPAWLAHYKPQMPKRPRPVQWIPPFSQGGLGLGSPRFSGQGSVQNLFIFTGHYSVSYPDYADANTLEMLSCLPQHSYTMYVVSFRAGLTDPPSDGRWLGVPGIGDEIVFVRRYEDALAIARELNANLQAVSAALPYEQVSGGKPVPPQPPGPPSEASKVTAAAVALNADLQARLARGETI